MTKNFGPKAPLTWFAAVFCLLNTVWWINYSTKSIIQFTLFNCKLWELLFLLQDHTGQNITILIFNLLLLYLQHYTQL